MYKPVPRRNCVYCGRVNHMSNSCRYKSRNLAKITRDSKTKQLKKHFSRKIRFPREEANRANPSLTNKPSLTITINNKSPRQDNRPQSICQNVNRKTGPNGTNCNQKLQMPDSNSAQIHDSKYHDEDCQIIKEVSSPLKKSSAASPSSSTTTRKYVGCKDCETLHQEVNYWKEENKRLKNQQNVIDFLARENKILMIEKNSWKDLFNLRDCEML